MPQPFSWITKQQIINNIKNQNAAYTYGPGSPNPTTEDLNTRYGNAGNILHTGNVALSPAQAALFTPQERAQYGIADTAPGSHTGADIEMFYGSGANSSPSFWQGGDRAFEWDPKTGGILGKIGSHMPGASTYLQGQGIFDFLRGTIGKVFGLGQDAQQGAVGQVGRVGNVASPWQAGGIPDNLQPATPGYSFAPGFGGNDPNAPAAFVPPPWIMPPPKPEYGGAGFGNYAQAQNAFIPGLIDWNGPGAANPTGGEPIGDSAMALRHGYDLGGLAARFGMSGQGAVPGMAAKFS